MKLLILLSFGFILSVQSNLVGSAEADMVGCLFLLANFFGIEALRHGQGPVRVVLVGEGVLDRVALTNLNGTTGVCPVVELLVVTTTEKNRLVVEALHAQSVAISCLSGC